MNGVQTDPAGALSHLGRKPSTRVEVTSYLKFAENGVSRRSVLVRPRSIAKQ
jgi:hypothetical protein